MRVAKGEILSPKAMPTVLGDFDQDGFLDAAVADFEHDEVLILAGLGGCRFRIASRHQIARPVALVAGDFNGDGATDLAVASWTSGEVTVLLGRGDGGFSVVWSFPAPRPLALHAIDLDGDARLDLLVCQEGGITMLFAAGQGTFTLQRPAPAAWRLTELTPRETQVTRLASKGYRASEIARLLRIGVRTVETHLSSAIAKLGVSSKSELVRLPQLAVPTYRAGWRKEEAAGGQIACYRGQDQPMDRRGVKALDVADEDNDLVAKGEDFADEIAGPSAEDLGRTAGRDSHDLESPGWRGGPGREDCRRELAAVGTKGE
jgi:DNA-binding CsgD family transcriptional regulator